MTPVSGDTLGVILPAAKAADVARFIGPLNAAMERFGVVTPERQAAFLAQVGFESGNLACLAENLTYSHADRIVAVFPTHVTAAEAPSFVQQPIALANRVYAGRNGNGDEASGDGWKYRGRGLIQLTGRANYAQASQAIYSDQRLIIAPETLEQPDGAALSAGWYWERHALNELADEGDFRAITKAVNGGFGGYNERAALWATAKEVLL